MDKLVIKPFSSGSSMNLRASPGLDPKLEKKKKKRKGFESLDRRMAKGSVTKKHTPGEAELQPPKTLNPMLKDAIARAGKTSSADLHASDEIKPKTAPVADDTPTPHNHHHAREASTSTAISVEVMDNFFKQPRRGTMEYADNLNKALYGKTYHPQHRPSIQRYVGMEKCCCVIKPDSYLKSTWDFMIGLLTLFSFFITPFSIAFDGITAAGQWPIETWNGIEYLFDAFFITDMVASFFTAYVDDGVLIKNNSSIALHYLQSWFSIDLLSSIPYSLLYDLLVTTEGKAVEAKFTAYFRLFRTVRLMRLLRIVKLRRSLVVRSGSANTSLLLNMGFLLFTTLGVVHLAACLWHFIGTEFANVYAEGTWLMKFMLLDPNVSIMHHYIASLYFAVITLTTTGYGDYVPQNDAEKVFVMITALTGSFLFAYISGKLASIASSFDASSSAFLAKMQQLEQFMEAKGLPNNVKSQFRRYYNNRFPQGVYYDEKSVIDELPSQYQHLYYLALNREIIKKVPFFYEADNVFISEVVRNLEPLSVESGQYVVKIGDVGHHMFIVAKGEVVVEDQFGYPVRSLGEGSFFGEVCLIYPHKRRTVSVVASTHCKLYALSQTAMDKILLDFPEFREAMTHIADLRLQGDDDGKVSGSSTPTKAAQHRSGVSFSSEIEMVDLAKDKGLADEEAKDKDEAASESHTESPSKLARPARRPTSAHTIAADLLTVDAAMANSEKAMASTKSASDETMTDRLERRLDRMEAQLASLVEALTRKTSTNSKSPLARSSSSRNQLLSPTRRNEPVGRPIAASLDLMLEHASPRDVIDEDSEESALNRFLSRSSSRPPSMKIDPEALMKALNAETEMQRPKAASAELSAPSSFSIATRALIARASSRRLVEKDSLV